MIKIKLLLLFFLFLFHFSTGILGVAAAPDSDLSEFDEAVNMEMEDKRSGNSGSEFNLKNFFKKTKDSERLDDGSNESFEQPVEPEDLFEPDNDSQDLGIKENYPANQGSNNVIVDGYDNDGAEEGVELDDEMLDILDQYRGLIKRKQFTKANDMLDNIPLAALNKQQRKQKHMLDIFESIAADKAENERQFGKDESLDEDVLRTIKRLQRQAKVYILEDRKTLPKDLLIQSLYLDRKNYESKQLLDRCLGMSLGSYQVENVEKKYWNDSLIQLRSGLPSKSVDSLEMLANFDPENPMIFERMGSAFYMSGQVKKAVDAWKRALYLNPNRKDLQTFIRNAEKEVTRQEKLANVYFDRKKKASSNDTQKSKIPMQVLRVVNDSNTAFSYAQEVRQQLGKGSDVVVEELDNGKWAVKVPIKKGKE
tara:strand:- start:185 stop:1453 length:1269 start_codon:yes stop_codon:yes gene_type:complete